MYIAVNCNTATNPTNPQIRRELIRYDYIQNSASYQADQYFLMTITDWQTQIQKNFANKETNLDEAQNYAILNLNPFEIEMFKACHPSATIHGQKPLANGQTTLF